MQDLAVYAAQSLLEVVEFLRGNRELTPEPPAVELLANSGEDIDFAEVRGQEKVKRAMERLGLSARAYSPILKISRTFADLEGQPEIQTPHLAEAI